MVLSSGVLYMPVSFFFLCHRLKTERMADINMKERSFVKKQTDYSIPGTVAWKTRKKRMNDFNVWFDKLFIHNKTRGSSDITILDVGGVPEYWKYLGFKYLGNVRITSLNIVLNRVPCEFKDTIISVIGNATDMHEYNDDAFDLVFSNSVIEHVGTFKDQQNMAWEMQRVAPHGYLQTPNKFFFMEPHFLFPFFQFLPVIIRVLLVQSFSLGHFAKAETREAAIEMVNSVQLLSYKQLRTLFPDAKIYKEKWMGLTKSFVLKW